MATLKELESKYLGRQFENGGGYTTKEYETFQTKYLNYLRSICRERGWELMKPLKGHYEFSVFIKDENGHFVYFSICDVRYWQDQWYTHILIRGAKHEKDYHGMTNYYTDLPDAADNVAKIFGYLKRWAENNAEAGAVK